AAGHAFGVGRERFEVLVPAERQLAALEAINLVGKVRELPFVLLELCEPGIAQFLAALTDSCLIVLVDAVEQAVLEQADLPGWILGVRVRLGRRAVLERAPIELLGLANRLPAERLTVGVRGVLFPGDAPGNMAVDDDERRPIRRGLESVQG